MRKFDRLVFATNNEHKLREAREILGDSLELVSLAEIGCHDDIPETADSLAGNALQKAHYVHQHYGVACIADDTGLMCDALGGAPGVRSARYAGPGHDSAANMRKLLAELDGSDNRNAHFSTILALVTDEEERTFEGRVDGTIARTPNGSNGFGYDPLFVPDETGIAFAAMSEEAKNAISHRGRAFRAFAAWLAGLATIIIMLLPLPAHADSWRLHASYDGQMEKVIDTPRHCYFLAMKQYYNYRNAVASARYAGLLRYDKDNDEWQWLDTTTGLSEAVVTDAVYDYTNRKLVIAYDNGNIDLLDDEGDIVNIPALLTAGSHVSTDIRHAAMGTDGYAWLTTLTGWISIDTKRGEVVTSRDYGRQINAAVPVGDTLFIGTEEGLYAGTQRTGSFDDFTRVGEDNLIFSLQPLGNTRLYYMTGTPGDAGVTRVTASADGWQLSRRIDNVSGMNPGRDGITAWSSRNILWIDAKGNQTLMKKPQNITHARNHNGGSLDGKDFFISSGRDGISEMRTADGGKTWTVSLDGYKPNAAHAFMATNLTYSDTYGMLVRNHGNEQHFADNTYYTQDLLCGLRDGIWTPLSAELRGANTDGALTLTQPLGTAIDPNNKDHVYCGSTTSGLLRVDMADPTKSLRFSRANDPAAGKPGFITVTPEPVNDWKDRCAFSAPVFDQYGILWSVHFDGDNKQRTQLWYWMPEDRAATTSSSNYRAMRKLTIPSPCGSLPLVTALTGSRRNILVVYHSDQSNHITVIDHNATPGTTGDDRRITFSPTTDQYGSSFDPGAIHTMYEDSNTGNVWIGGNGGVCYLNPTEILEGKEIVNRIRVSRDDGTGLADYLLDGVTVAAITADQAGRKWFATFGAGIVVTSADGREIIRTYTTDNSDLPDNTVHGMAYNPDNNTMLISTARGLCEMPLAGTGADGDDNAARAYPNPVQPGYLGLVTIDGLPEMATAKVVDVHGNLIAELGTAAGGEVTWDITNLKKKRVPGGIYYIIASNGPDQDKFHKMTKILVVE